MNTSTITVITPFHNTDRELFISAVSSMKAQRFPADRIEWIIVVHNSDDGYLDFVRETTADLKNVSIYELNNDKRTASSPRNYALEHIHGTYITFLDSDDMLTPECLSTIVRGMDETGAQLGKYRGERRQEDESIASFLDNRVRFSQIKSLICINKGDPDLTKLLTMANMMMSCQVIRTEFLQEHNIRFREDIRFEEDVVFNLECLNHASKIAVFPQMIGYIYYMHHGSTMQETTLSDSRILQISHDLAIQLELGLGYGFDMRYLFIGHMKMIAEELVKVERDITVRQQVRDHFLPFYQKIPLPEPNDKFLSKDEIRRISYESESIILGYDVFDDGGEALRRIIRQNIDTELGQEWGFETVKTLEEYQSRVPLATYDTYSPFIELTTRIGESDIFCGEDIKGYALSSGSSGRRKRIPYVAGQITDNARELRQLLSGKGSTFLLMQSIQSEEKYADGTYLDSITGATLQAVEKELRYESFRLEDPDGAVTSPKEFFFASKGISSYHEKLLYALLDKHVTRIVAPFAWYVLDLFQYLERHCDTLLDDMREGKTLHGEKHPERADELAEVFAGGFDEPILPRIWPELEMVMAAGGGSFHIYTELLRRYSGDVLYHEGLYAASEGIFARFDAEINKYRLTNGEYFFEFREITEDGSEGRVLPLEQVEDGGTYEVIVTNNAGFYRYALGDVIRVYRKEDKELLFDLLYRRSNVIRLHGRTGSGVITPDSIFESVSELIGRHHLPVGDYCYTLSDSDCRLEVYLEQAGHGDVLLSSFDTEMLADEFDQILCSKSKGYADARIGKLDKCVIHYLQQETQAAYREICVRRSRLTPDQMKPVRYMDNPAKVRFFKTFLL